MSERSGDADALEAFGRQIVEVGRDVTIDSWLAALDGTMSFPGAHEIARTFAALPPDQQAFVRRLVVAVTDEAVSNTLWALERMPWVTVLATNEATGVVTDLGVDSDGLSQALDGDDGWLATFGRHPEPAFGED